MQPRYLGGVGMGSGAELKRATRSGGDPFRANGRAFGIVYCVSALSGLLSIAIPHGTHFATWAALPLSVGALATGCWAWRRRELGPVATHILLGTATAMVSAGVYAGHGDDVSMSAAVLYVVVALGAGVFASPRGALAQVVVMASVYAAILGISGNNAAVAEWVFISGAASLSAWVTSRSRTELMHLALADSLTGLANRNGLRTALDQELARAARSGEPLSVALIDLDSFKALNDAEGHLAGDRALVDLVDAWSSQLRGGDLLARFGGDEFVLVLPGLPVWQACRVLQRLHRVESRLPWSAGLATWDGHESVGRMLERADQSLYRAKQRGAASWLAVARPVVAHRGGPGTPSPLLIDGASRARPSDELSRRREAG